MLLVCALGKKFLVLAPSHLFNFSLLTAPARYAFATPLLRPNMQQTPINIDLLRLEASFRSFRGGGGLLPLRYLGGRSSFSTGLSGMRSSIAGIHLLPDFLSSKFPPVSYSHGLAFLPFGTPGTAWDGSWDGLNLEITQCLPALGRRDGLKRW